jgi:sialidase-1
MPLQVIAQPASGSYNNPTIVELPNRTILLHYQHYPANTHEYDVQPGLTGPQTVQTYQITSRDQGKTWSNPTNLTSQIKDPRAHTLASGPGIGIVHSKGPIIIPYNQRIGDQWHVNMAISTNGGKTWRQGQPLPAFPEYQPNEVQIAELDDGRILLNCRNQAAGKFRLVAISFDQGETWSGAQPEPLLPDPTCQAALLSIGSNTLAFSNPASTTSRSNGTLRLSFDSGQTWPVSKVIEPGSFQYSSLANLGPNQIGILYEHVVRGQYQLRFRRATINRPLP